MTIVVNALLLIACVILALRVRSYRRAYKALKGQFKSPIREASPAEILPELHEDELGPGRASEVVFIGSGPASPSDRETWLLGVFAKRCSHIFEFGTASGRTTYLLARNAPATARITTLTLSPQERPEYRRASGDSEGAAHAALEESAFQRFLYSGSDVESRISQLYGDSKSFDHAPYRQSCDLIFIDGSHAYSYVKSDTEKAFEMLKPGGIILWHDYRGPQHAATADVYRYLNELAMNKPLLRMKETSLVVYRDAA